MGVKATQQPRKLLIKAGDPAASYLFQKIVGTPGIAGIMMPQGCPGNPIGGAACLASGDTSAIEEWINECATATPSLP